jgi:VWFA-related protein
MWPAVPATILRMASLLILLSAALSAQEAPVFRAGVTLVKVDAQVLGGEGPVADLTREDFAVFDEDQPQRIAYFGHEAEPLSVLLLLDVSGSMGRFLKQMAAAARDALRALAGGDEAAVMLFSRGTALILEFTSDLDEVARRLGETGRGYNLGAATSINSAVIDACAVMRRSLAERDGRRAIVLVTDNGGMNYQIPTSRVVRALLETDAVLNVIATADAEPPPPPRPGLTPNPDFTPSDVFTLARETGGEVVRTGRGDTAFGAMLERVRTRYALHYHSPGGAPGSFRRIRVELSPDARRRLRGAEIRARSGYFIP